jgi:transcriptional accessory protein Tex/SPT6
VAALSFNAWYTQIQAAEQDGLLMLEIFLHDDTISAFEDELGRCWESADSEPHPEVWNKLRHEIVQEAIHGWLIPAAVTWLRDDLKQRADDIVAERCQKELENVSLWTEPCALDAR